MVVLTWNEEANIRSCLASLAAQTDPDFEVIVIDAASTDRTVERVQEAQAQFPVPLRLETYHRKLPIGEARNLGVALARSPNVAFLSADAEASTTWVHEARSALERYDLVFGPQVHDPRRWTTGAAVRGLRYHFPDGPAADPLRYASNVSSAYRKGVLVEFPFDPAADAAEDLLLAQRAHAAGYRAVYGPGFTVRHHDVVDARQELRKSIREGQAWGVHGDTIGFPYLLVAWAVALLVSCIYLIVEPSLALFVLLLIILWAPALRRLARRRKEMPARALLLGAAASPAFDLLFLANYLRGLGARLVRRGPPLGPKETLP